MRIAGIHQKMPSSLGARHCSIYFLAPHSSSGPLLAPRSRPTLLPTGLGDSPTKGYYARSERTTEVPSECFESHAPVTSHEDTLRPGRHPLSVLRVRVRFQRTDLIQGRAIRVRDVRPYRPPRRDLLPVFVSGLSQDESRRRHAPEPLAPMIALRQPNSRL